MARRNLSRKVTYFEPVPPRLPRNTVIEFDLHGGPSLPSHDPEAAPFDRRQLEVHRLARPGRRQPRSNSAGRPIT